MRLKRWVVILVVAGWMGTSPGWLTAQAVQAKATAHFAPVAPGESLPNLDKLKDRLRRYHDCTCSCGCYAKDLDAQATRAMAFL
ncbi:MAG TPA: hypothetical protein VFI20_12075, partial [Terracidiphilus sp.]|nr:hypothetical protein [Terracidiphilus sp.]